VQCTTTCRVCQVADQRLLDPRGRLPVGQGSSWALSDRLETFDDAGAGAREIRIKDASGVYRVIYVAKFEEAIYVLHCFQKKTQATSKQDKAIAEARYRAVANARKETK
jgi:phage-related protein